MYFNLNGIFDCIHLDENMYEVTIIIGQTIMKYMYLFKNYSKYMITVRFGRAFGEVVVTSYFGKTAERERTRRKAERTSLRNICMTNIARCYADVVRHL